MTNKIVRVRYLSLRRREQYAFNEHVIRIVDKYAPNQSLFFVAFKEASVKFSTALQSLIYRPKKVVVSKDALADRAWSAFNYQIKASLLNARDDVREAAEQVSVVFNRIKSPNHKAYFHAYSDQSMLIQELESIPAETLELAHCTECLSQLRTAAENLTEASTDAFTELPVKKVNDMKTIVSECYKCWQDLARYLEMKIVEGDLPGAEDAADRLSIFTSLLNSKLKARMKKKSEDGDQKKSGSDDVDDDNEPNLVDDAIAEAGDPVTANKSSNDGKGTSSNAKA